jgi:hypothetical protein
MLAAQRIVSAEDAHALRFALDRSLHDLVLAPDSWHTPTADA